MSGWTIPLDRLIAKAKGDLDLVARKTVLTTYRRVIMRTPVDTGRARGNWLCSVGAPVVPTEGLAAVNDTDASGGSTVNAMQGTVMGEWKPLTGHSCYLVNNVPYIGRLEDGHSRQAPSGMVKLTVAELGGIAQDAAGGGA